MPDPYDIFVYPDLRFNVRPGRENLKQDLVACFPREKEAINKYFTDLKKAGGWSSRFTLSRSLPGWSHFISPLFTVKGSGLAGQTTGEYLRQNFKDPRLRAVLVSQWGNYGLPPQLSSFVIHATIVNHYLDGAYYPAGGAKTIADSVIPPSNRRRQGAA